MRFLACVLALALGAPAAAGACTLHAVAEKRDAELVVYFTRFPKEDVTAGRYRSCRIVREKEAGSQSFFVTLFRQDANTVVHRSNWPSR